MVLRLFLRCLVVFFLGLACAACAWAQAGAEYGSATAKAGATAAGAKLPKPNLTPPATSGQPQSAHLPIQTGESVAAGNVRSLQEHAGPDAAKLSLQSVPDHAQVWLNGLFVGATPLNLTLAPGRYRVEMRSAAKESGRQEIELVPKQSRQVAMTLAPRYPKKISLR